MGLFYTNITLYGANQQQVAQHLKTLGRVAYVSPTIDSFTVVYDMQTEDQNEQELIDLACGLSRAFRCSALAALVHDSDVFAYWLYELGKLKDKYNSAPTYFDSHVAPSPPSGGKSKTLCKAFRRKQATEDVRRIFESVKADSLDDDRSPDYLFAEDIHRELVAALGMPTFAAVAGYYVIENGEMPEGLDRAALSRCT